MRKVCRLTFVFLLLFLFLSQPAIQAEELCTFKNWDSLMAAVANQSGEIKVFKDQKNSLESSRAVAGLSPLASVSGQFYKDLDHIGEGEIEGSYRMVWENKRKRETRLGVVDESLRALEANRDLTQAKQKIDIIIGLNRLQQIAFEQAALVESRDTYKRLSGKLRNLPALSPEQRLTLSIFQLAEDESQTKIANLEADKVPFLKVLARLTACDETKVSFRLKAPKDLPKTLDRDSPAVLALQSQRGVASAEQRSAEAANERNIEFGPIFRLNRENEDTNVAAGLSFSLPLTGDTRSPYAAEAKARYLAKESEINWQLNQIENEKKQWTEQYRIASESLSKRWDLNDFQEHHKTMETLFSSGRINASLIIEGHRQILESLKTRHALESLAFEAYWNVLFLSGTILEVNPS